MTSSGRLPCDEVAELAGARTFTGDPTIQDVIEFAEFVESTSVTITPSRLV